MQQGYLVHEVAKELGIHVNTVRNWERQGVIHSQRDYRGYRIFSETELLKAKLRLSKLEPK